MRELDAVTRFFRTSKTTCGSHSCIINEWQQQANAWIRTTKPKYMHTQQIDNAADAMEQFVVQSFYKETSKKRFIQSMQSVQYTLSKSFYDI